MQRPIESSYVVSTYLVVFGITGKWNKMIIIVICQHESGEGGNWNPGKFCNIMFIINGFREKENCHIENETHLW